MSKCIICEKKDSPLLFCYKCWTARGVELGSLHSVTNDQHDRIKELEADADALSDALDAVIEERDQYAKEKEKLEAEVERLKAELNSVCDELTGPWRDIENSAGSTSWQGDAGDKLNEMIAFKECSECEAKPGTPTLCDECIERRKQESATPEK